MLVPRELHLKVPTERYHHYLRELGIANLEEFEDDGLTQPKRTFKLMRAHATAMERATSDLLTDLKINGDHDDPEAQINDPVTKIDSNDLMFEFDKMIWSYEILEQDCLTVRTTLSEQDSFEIRRLINRRKKNPHYSPIHRYREYEINVQTMRAHEPSFPEIIYVVRRSPNNNRERPNHS